ncbi:hypothetical protein CB1_000224007 [Camelus ferus]|nr:hypothetical protein CB1_000224007 [Camelus ferus]
MHLIPGRGRSPRKARSPVQQPKLASPQGALSTSLDLRNQQPFLAREQQWKWFRAPAEKVLSPGSGVSGAFVDGHDSLSISDAGNKNTSPIADAPATTGVSTERTGF